ncbi:MULTISPECIES: VirB4 family type IV secretion system protein [Nocardiopsis]|uniref:Conjugal transfer protein TraC n=1 Tax=Nocardiopsis sinuspersici TaxID=501010 RepID=A0A1V3BUP9_9ACTN|nr:MULTISPECIES: ATP-binding protein [Nocardiopsis]OOC50887.1 conjugal transfer protein TraC [Nocardiopsis sinuspersici]
MNKDHRRPLGGPAIRLYPRHLDLDGRLAQTMIVTGYPHDVHAGWADPLLTYPGHVDIAVHVVPVPGQLAAHRLRRRRARLESAWRTDAARGGLEDPLRAAAAEDAALLAERVAGGEARLFRLAVYLTVHAATPEELDAEVRRLSALAGSILVDLAPATYRPLAGWIATLPLGTDPVEAARTMDTDAVAALMPLSSPDLAADLGETTVVYGENVHSGGLVAWDWFNGDLDNGNAVIVILARSGNGKFYLAKLELLRALYMGVRASVIDPTDEYAALADAVGGRRVRLGLPDGRLNPFDLPDTGEQAFTTRILFLHTLVSVMVGALDAAESATLDRAVLATYAERGITRGPATWNRTPPILADLVATLRGTDDEADHAGTAHLLADKLAPFTDGSHRGLFDGLSTATLTSHLTVISLRHLPDELRTTGLLMALDALWSQVRDSAHRQPRLITIDEGWSLLRDAVGAKYLFNFAKNARRHWAGLTLVTQDVADLLATDLGRAVAANAATQILLRQAPQNLDAVCESFHLSHGERQIVATAERGSALLTSGHHRAVLRALASPEEHRLITTDPAELARMDKEDQ